MHLGNTGLEKSSDFTALLRKSYDMLSCIINHGKSLGGK